MCCTVSAKAQDQSASGMCTRVLAIKYIFKISFGSYVLLSLKTEYRHSNNHETKCKFYFALKIPNYMAFWRYKNIHIFFADQYERYWSIFNLHQCRDILNFDLCWSQEILHGVIVQMKRKLKWVGNAQMATSGLQFLQAA